jgi:autotransporter translocation and assembly factor TamB
MQPLPFLSTMAGLLLLLLSLSGQALAVEPGLTLAGRWRSTGPDALELTIRLKGKEAEGTWTLPYDADGKPAKLTLSFQGQIAGDHVKGPYHGRVEVVGQPEIAETLEGTAELHLQKDGQTLRVTLSVPGENGETQTIEFRRL